MKSYTYLTKRCAKLGRIKVPLSISDIIDAETSPRAIKVRVAATGKPAWIPRRVNPEFAPGVVMIPIWLHNRLFS